MNFSFLPTLPFTLSYPLLFGVLLVAGMLGGELARIARIPRIVGYVVVGFLLAPFTQAMGMGSLLDEARIFVDLALGLVLFDLGRRMDLKWMKRDWTIAATGFAESLLAFSGVLGALLALRYDPVMAALAAAIAMTTSPAVLMLLVHDNRSEGQVTERAMNLTALNGLLASLLVTILLGSAHYEAKSQVEVAVLQPLYLLLGSLTLGAAMSWISRAIARHIEKTREVHFALIAGMVVCAVGLATMLKLPVILALLSFGLFARNDDRSYDLLNVNLAPVGRLLYIVLFVITGASLPLSSLIDGGLVGLLVAAARAAGKVTGVLALAPLGGLRVRQAAGLGAAVLPMSSLALLMQHDIARLFPAFATELSAVLLSAILVMEIIGPLAVQWGLRFAGDVLPADPGATTRIPARLPTAPGD
jgi:Kef-type K+ transport system membrane component KefB